MIKGMAALLLAACIIFSTSAEQGADEHQIGIDVSGVQVHRVVENDRVVYVVSHIDIPPSSVMSFREIRNIFTLKKTRWGSGHTIVIFVFDNKDPIHKQFCEDVLGMYCYQLSKTWAARSFSGFATPPLVVDNTENLIQSISSTPGAIGYIYGDSVDERIKVITVQ